MCDTGDELEVGKTSDSLPFRVEVQDLPRTWFRFCFALCFLFGLVVGGAIFVSECALGGFDPFFFN